MEIAFIIVWVTILFEGKISSFLTISAIVRVITMLLHVSKYLPNVIFRNANINAQCANVSNSMNWYNDVEPLM